jgi:hypothetical protein
MAQLETTRNIVLRLAMRVDEIMDQHSGVENGTFPRVVQHYWVNRQSDKITQEATGIIIECPRLGVPLVLLNPDGTFWSQSMQRVDLNVVVQALETFAGLIGQAQDEGLTGLKISRKKR